MTNTSISEETDIDQLCEKLVKCIVDVSNVVVPTSQYCPHKKPYWSPELKALHVNQKQLRRVWIEEGRPRGPVYMSYVNYKKAKHIFAKTLKTQALMYEQKQFHDVSMSRDMNIKQFWKYIRRNRNHQENISVMRDEEKTYVTPEQQLDMWKTHFGTILNESEYESAQYDKEFKTEIEHNVQVMKSTMDKYSQPSSVNLANISVNEVKQVCMSLSPGKAPGVDRLTYEHFKYAGNVFFETLTVLYNNILHYVHIPPHFKEGLLVTIYKGHGKPKDKKDSYRGVTLLPAINKVFEKCIFNRIQPFFDHIKFPPPLQNASRKGISNVMVSFMANEAIYSCTEKGGKVFACLLDIEKCFDKLWWDGLLFKMHKIGFDNKMWFLMYDWFQGSNCRVCFNGHVSDAFNITRSIKQGGILSMINLCIFMYDIHNSIDEHSDLGLCCNDIYVGSPTFADDVMLLSSTKNNLDKMMANAWVYSQKWRFTFSLTKSKCMVFGESKRNHLANVRHRIFNLGNHVLQEVSHYDHLGVKLCAYDSSRERTNDACQKGNRSLAALTPCGTKGNGLYPYVSSFLWNRLCIPAMLHGCEVWYELCHYELDLLERTQCRSLRKVQHLPPRTHNVIVRGLLGELSMQARIRMMKLQFLQRLVNMNCNYLVKKIFLQRLYECIINNSMKGFFPDILGILETCRLKDHLMIYMKGGRFPSKYDWKLTVINSVMTYDYDRAKHNLSSKTDCDRFIRTMDIDNHVVMHPFYSIMRRSRNLKDNKALWAVIRLIALPSLTYNLSSCRLCGKDITDVACHVITQCPTLYEERNVLWEYIMDTLDVRQSVHVSCMDDEQFLETVLFNIWNGFRIRSQDETDKWYCGIAGIICEHFFHNFTINYDWLRNYS
jgi:hypothetical protein